MKYKSDSYIEIIKEILQKVENREELQNTGLESMLLAS
jgi:hypothetical protein